MMPKALFGALIIALTAAFTGNSYAATLIITGGQATGATGVYVGGALFDVDFIDGSCIDLFDGCDEPSDFAFDTSTLAAAASTALFNLFNSPGNENFTNSPGLTNGCSGTINCSIITPFGIESAPSPSVSVFHFANFLLGPFLDEIVLGSISRFGDSSFSASLVWAVWSPNPVAAIPLPVGGVLLLTGIAGIAFLKKRKYGAE